MIVFRQKYPRWWFDWNLEVQRSGNRVVAFLVLMHDRYPATDQQQSVRLDYPYPDVPRELNRWLPLVTRHRPIPAIPPGPMTSEHPTTAVHDLPGLRRVPPRSARVDVLIAPSAVSDALVLTNHLMTSPLLGDRRPPNSCSTTAHGGGDDRAD